MHRPVLLWRTIRSRLERWGVLTPPHDKLTLTGRVRTCGPLTGAETSSEGGTISIRLEGGHQFRHRPGRTNTFRFELPATDRFVLLVEMPGHLPRMVEVRPYRTVLRSAIPPRHLRHHLEIVLTPRFRCPGSFSRPLTERITLPNGRGPLIVEWDHVARPEPEPALVPLFLRPR